MGNKKGNNCHSVVLIEALVVYFNVLGKGPINNTDASVDGVDVADDPRRAWIRQQRRT